MVSNFKQALDYRKGKGSEASATERDSSPTSAFISSLFMVCAVESCALLLPHLTACHPLL